MDEVDMSYEKTIQLAKATLSPTHPSLLGLILNYSVFCFEIKGDVKLACMHANYCFDEAMANLDKTSEEHYKDSTVMMKLIQDNLLMWSESGEKKKKPA